jgi:ATP-dependent protease HslVU (ClpYQ) peptidase subunit
MPEHTILSYDAWNANVRDRDATALEALKAFIPTADAAQLLDQLKRELYQDYVNKHLRELAVDWVEEQQRDL